MKINYEFEENRPYEYKVDNSDLSAFLVNVLFDTTKWLYDVDLRDEKSVRLAKFFVYDLDLVEELAEHFYEEIKEYFYQRACDEYWGK